MVFQTVDNSPWYVTSLQIRLSLPGGGGACAMASVVIGVVVVTNFSLIDFFSETA